MFFLFIISCYLMVLIKFEIGGQQIKKEAISFFCFYQFNFLFY